MALATKMLPFMHGAAEICCQLQCRHVVASGGMEETL
jgi:hypothetical protein